MAGSHHRRRHTSYYTKRRRRRRHHPYRQRDSPPQQQQDSSCMEVSMEDSEYNEDVFIPVAVPLLDIGITSWLPLVELGGAWHWCSSRVTQSLEWMKDAVFPSRVYQRQLQDTKDQLMLLQQQLEQLQAKSIKVLDEKPSPICNCNCQHQMPAASHISAVPSTKALTTAWPTQPTNSQGVQATADDDSPAPAMALIRPPPPPPPPPPISLPKKALVFKKKKTTKPTASQSSNKRPMVTLSDIMNVKLKKVSCPDTKQVHDVSSYACNQRAVVTLTDIMNIQLKKTFRDRKGLPSGLCEISKDDTKPVKLRKRRSVNQVNNENANNMVLRSRISQEVLQFRGCLRKVSMVRSPGGTPLRGNLTESHGTGLTPLMTKALRRKFRTIRTPSPSAKDDSAISPSFNAST